MTPEGDAFLDRRRPATATSHPRETTDEHPGCRQRGRRQRRRARRPHLLLRRRRDGRLLGRPLASPDEHGEPRRVGARWPLVRHVGHVVPARRRPLHGLHVRGGARGDVGLRRRQRLLRRAVHDHPLPHHLHLHVAPLVGLAPPRLRDACGLRPGPFRARVACPSRSRSPASSRRCPTSPSSSSASRPFSRSSASAAAATGSPRTCRSSSPSSCSRSTPTPRVCGRRRSSRSSRTS